MKPMVRLISATETIPLRSAVLRPGRPIEAAQFAGDDLPTTKHLGAFRAGQLVGIASLFSAESPDYASEPALQLRGMATADEVRGEGFGRALVVACEAFARDSEIKLLWCNARKSAIAFYEQLGWHVTSDEFDIPDVGPHVRMVRRL